MSSSAARRSHATHRVVAQLVALSPAGVCLLPTQPGADPNEIGSPTTPRIEHAKGQRLHLRQWAALWPAVFLVELRGFEPLTASYRQSRPEACHWLSGSCTE